MIRYIVFLTLLSTFSLGKNILNESEYPPRPNLTDTRIVGGKVVEIADASYQVSLMYSNRHSCGGSLISSTSVISAAHCVHRRDLSSFRIRIGSSFINDGGVVVKVKKITTHPKYNPRNIDYDFAIIEMESFNNNGIVQSYVNLPVSGDGIKDGQMLKVTGWGSTQNNNESNKQLRAVFVPKVNQRTCSRAYSIFGGVTERMICAGFDKGGKDACQGDSGGPLVDPSNNTLIGVVSWGYGCASPRYPGVYGRISSVRSWIKSTSGI